MSANGRRRGLSAPGATERTARADRMAATTGDGLGTDLDCIACLARQSLEAGRQVTTDATVHEQVVRDALRAMATLDFRHSPPEVAGIVHRQLRARLADEDPYREVKQRSNQLLLGWLPDLAHEITTAPDALLATVKLAVAANAIDAGPARVPDDSAILQALRKALRVPLAGPYDAFRRALGAAQRILYLADNAGELVVDRLLIEAIGPRRTTLVVRGRAVINDATLADARAVGLSDLVEVLENGSDAPGTILGDCSPELRARFREADLVIAKGQGNFETLANVDANIYFLFMVKCAVVERHLGLPVGTPVIWHRRQNQAAGGEQQTVRRP